jgi:hypothetical protein
MNDIITELDNEYENILLELQNANNKISEEYKNKYKIVYEFNSYWNKPVFMVRKKVKKYIFFHSWELIRRKIGMFNDNYITAFNAEYHLNYTIKEDIILEENIKRYG